MNMQDKEIDQLFHSRLQGIEVEPSAGLWQNISAKMDTYKKRPVTIWLSVAASLLILLSAGLYFVQQNNADVKKPEQIFSQNNRNSEKNSIAPKAVEKIESVIAKGVKKEKIATVKAQKNEGVKNSFHPEENAARIVKIEPVNAKEQLVQLPPHREVLRAVVPDIETPLSIKTEIKENAGYVTLPATVTPQLADVQDNRVMAAAPAKKRRIRSIGDMLNAVISKVDKRKDKIIEFTNTDGDESTITAVNLGIIKIKKQ
jgi:hypothetical protein